MQSRRTFIKKGTWMSGLMLGGAFPFRSMAGGSTVKITVLYTQDTQSQLHPFPANAPKFPGLGGIKRRAELVSRIRSEEQHVLLLDAGNYFHGGMLFDTLHGEPEINAMNMLGYDAAGIGEHEFDGGMDNLALQLGKAQFDIVCSNYNLEKTNLAGNVKPYTVMKKEHIRIGIFGIGRPLKGYVPDEVSKSIICADPLVTAKDIVSKLRGEEKCTFIICLSQLGLYREKDTMSDAELAKESYGIDLIISGHSHRLLETPIRIRNKNNGETLVVQAGWGGVHLGRIDYLFSTRKNILSANVQTVEIGK